MSRYKAEYEKAVGKLISAIQKEWGEELGRSSAKLSEHVMGLAHDLLQARTPDKARELLGPMTLKQFLGEIWLKRHPKVNQALSKVESFLLIHKK